MERRRRGTRPPYKVIGPVTLMVMALIGIGVYLQFRETRCDAGATERLRTGFCRSLNRLPCKQCGPTGTM
jgi:hypothetical protein